MQKPWMIQLYLMDLALENQLHEKRSDEVDHSITKNKSQTSRRQYKRFEPKEISETNSGQRKKKFEFGKYQPKNVVEIKNSSELKPRQSHNGCSTPNLLLNRNSSQAIFRLKAQDLRTPELSAQKQVRFTIGNTADVQACSNQVIQRINPRGSEWEISAYESLAEQFRALQKDQRDYEGSQGITEQIINILPKQTSQKQKLQDTIHKHMVMRDIYFQKLGQIKEVYQQMVYFVKEQLVRYEIEISNFIKTFKFQFQRELKQFQINISKKAVPEVRTNQTSDKLSQAPTQNVNQRIPIRLDHSNIIGKIDKMKLKIQQISNLDSQFADNVGILDKLHSEAYNLELKKSLLGNGITDKYCQNIMQDHRKLLANPGNKLKEYNRSILYKEEA